MGSNQTNSGAKQAIGVVVWLTQKLFSLCVVITVISLVMNHVLGMGEWTYGDMRIADIAVRLPWLTLIVGTVYNVVCKSIAGIAEVPVKSALICHLLDISDDDTYSRDYYSRVLKMLTTSVCVSNIIMCALAFVLRGPLVGVLGHPIADIAVLLIAFVLPNYVTGIIAYAPAEKLKREDPELYTAWDDLVQSGTWERALLAASGRF